MPLWDMMSKPNLVEREASQIPNGVTALQVVATAYTKVQTQERM